MTLDTIIAEILSIETAPPSIFSQKPTAIPAEELIASGNFAPLAKPKAAKRRALPESVPCAA